MRHSIDQALTVEGDHHRPAEQRVRRFARGAISAFIAAAVVLSAPAGIGAGVAWADPYGYDDDGSVDVAPEPADDPGPVDPGPQDPGPADPGPEDSGPQDPGPVDPGPADPGPADPGPVDPGPDAGDVPPPAEDPTGGAGENPGGPDGSGSGGDPANPDESGATGSDGDVDPIPADTDIADAPDPDETLADAGLAELFDPEPADQNDLDDLRDFVETETTTTTESVETTSQQTISQWSSSWTRYDQFYQPVFSNPYRTPMSLVYTYDGSPRIVTIPPLQRAVLQVPQAGVYSFTSVANRGTGTPAISVGSFSGGGYAPAPGQPPPAKPAPVKPLRDVVVEFNLGGDKKYAPIVVSSVVDLGDDAAVGGRHLLLDGEIPVWGAWKSDNSSGQRVFQVNKTQTLPGLNEPGQSPPPGYTLKALDSSANSQASSEHSASSSKTIWIIVGIAAALAVAIAVGTLVFRRRKPTV